MVMRRKAGPGSGDYRIGPRSVGAMASAMASDIARATATDEDGRRRP